jgi:hypothetical protein
VAAKRFLCIRACTFKGRFWNPESRLDKDRIYIGAECKNPHFRELRDGEAVPSNLDEVPKVAALSQIQKKGMDLVLS